MQVKIMVGVVILVILGLALWYYYGRPKIEPVKTAEDAIEAISAPTLDVKSNPIEGKVPELNPVDRANPFKDAYKNPFE
ncbi:hypothetical protein A2926_03845 [Candidatus Giovannonibacteria bacterium RIFCSPLOWO2_01_FULL_44_40]|nr:MAG: hypothetical protein A2926_03845 [Candidatus Giovannonibacteria bacterium RIFCSPLOWO2_01_FULL_44_40]